MSSAISTPIPEIYKAIEDGGRTEGIPELGNAPLIRWALDILFELFPHIEFHSFEEMLS
jgi:hypothetical protein